MHPLSTNLPQEQPSNSLLSQNYCPPHFFSLVPHLLFDRAYAPIKLSDTTLPACKSLLTTPGQPTAVGHFSLALLLAASPPPGTFLSPLPTWHPLVLQPVQHQDLTGHPRDSPPQASSLPQSHQAAQAHLGIMSSS